MSKRTFVYATFIIAILSAACFFIPAPYGSLLSTFLIIAYAAYLILLTRSDRIDFSEKTRKRIKLCAWLAILLGFVVFFARVWGKTSHYNQVDPRGVTPSAKQLENMQRTTH